MFASGPQRDVACLWMIAALDKGEDGRQGANPDTFDWIP
jgi:hypothetical protein